MYSQMLFVLFLMYFVSKYSCAQKQKVIKAFRKDYMYIEGTQSFYKFHTIRKSWMNAKHVCAMEGADLFYPENDDEAQAVGSFWNETQCMSYIYVGISTLLVEGLYTTVDGKTVGQVYNNWNKCEPDVNTEACVVLSKAGVNTDEPCSYKYPFICKKNQKSLEWNAPCGMPNIDYTFNESEGKCYKFHNTTMTWQDAYKTCFAEQSHLAVINSRKEKNYLLSLIGKSKDPTIPLNETVHMGFHNRLGDGWQTVTGTPLENSGYVNWGISPVESSESMKKCGAMSYSGHLYDVSCDKKSFFICEHDVDTHIIQRKIESTTPRAH